MTYYIPHGVYLKLEKIPGIYKKVSLVSGRDLFHLQSNMKEYMMVDNGHCGNSFTWRFLNMPMGSFNFGEEYLPITAKITDKSYIFTNSKAKELVCDVTGGKIFLEILEAYYGWGLPHIKIEDQRESALLKLVTYKEQHIKDLKKEIKILNKQLDILGEDIDYIKKNGTIRR